MTSPALVLPYLDPYDGPQRTVWITVQHPTTWLLAGLGNVTVGIDGRLYAGMPWVCGFRVPADRPVHVSVTLDVVGGNGGWTRGVGHLVMPHAADAQVQVESRPTSVSSQLYYAPLADGGVPGNA